MSQHDVQLAKLWRTRAKTLHKLAEHLGKSRFGESSESMANVIEQCANELEKPPTELFDKLGITSDAEKET